MFPCVENTFSTLEEHIPPGKHIKGVFWPIETFFTTRPRAKIPQLKFSVKSFKPEPGKDNFKELVKKK